MVMPNTSWEQLLFDLGEFVVGATSMATHQFTCVKLHTDGTVIPATAGSAAIGIMKDNGGIGEPCAICVIGVFPTLAASDISSGVANPMVALTPGTDGGVKAASTGDVVIGYSLEPMVAGEVHPILVLPRMQAGTLPSTTAGQTLYSSGTSLTALAAGTQGMQYNQGATNPAWGNTAAYAPFSYSFELDGALGTGSKDILTDMVPGFAGTIEKFYAIVSKAGVGTSATIAFHVEIGAAATTGGVVTLTEANTATLGAVVASGAVISGAKTFTASDTISILAASGTAFSAGRATFVMILKPTNVVI